MAHTGVDTYSNRYKTTLSFQTYSDSLLAGLFLENSFPIHLIRKLFDVLRDPKFSPAELSFDNAADFFTSISKGRAAAAEKRPVQSANASFALEPHAELHRPGIPPLALDLVVDRMLADATPFGVLIGRQYYDALEQNLWSLSRVHHAWTARAQRALRPRARIALDYIGRFLLSPLCGPWITDLAVYAPTESSTGLITDEHVWLLECLFARTPNVRMLSFHTLPLLKFTEGNHYENIAKCVQLVPKYLSLVEKMWLDHDIVNNKTEPCPKLEDLRRTLVRMPRLKFLSMKGWTDGMIEENAEHPPLSLQEIELASLQDMERAKSFYSWLLRPREEYTIHSLSLALSHASRGLTKSLEELLESSLPTVRKLQLCFGKDEFGTSPHEPTFSSILQHCTALTELDLFVSSFKHNPPSRLALPPTLQNLRIHYNAPWSHLYANVISGSQQNFDADMSAVVHKLPVLRSFTITGSRPARSFPHSFELDALMHHIQGSEVEEKHCPRQTRELCMQRGVQFACLDDAFPRQWEYTVVPGQYTQYCPVRNVDRNA